MNVLFCWSGICGKSILLKQSSDKILFAESHTVDALSDKQKNVKGHVKGKNKLELFLCRTVGQKITLEIPPIRNFWMTLKTSSMTKP